MVQGCRIIGCGVRRIRDRLPYMYACTVRVCSIRQGGFLMPRFLVVPYGCVGWGSWWEDGPPSEASPDAQFISAVNKSTG